MQPSPFKFLDSYTRDDRDIFFGRDREIEELYQRVFDSKLLLVYGVSGTGKSSLIHCGLANKFQETDWLPLVVRRGGNIIESMAAEITASSITSNPGKFETSADFKKAVKSLYLDHYKPIFFIFDQFEELFIFGSKEERNSFVQIVKTLIESDLQCRLIFVMREEYMAWITEFERYIPSFFANRVRIEKMSHLNALEAINKPCKVFNISLEEGFAETLLENLSPGSTEVELTFLQVFLDKIFRLAQNENKSSGDLQQITFTLSLLNKVGNVSDLLGSFLDEQIEQLDDPDTAMTVLKAFVSGKGTKRPASENETVENVRALGKEISTESVVEYLQTFVRLRVLRDKDDHGRYELRHDSLAQRIFEKFSLAEKELLELRQFIENAYQYYLKRSILLSSDDLTFISDRDTILKLSEDIQNFILESRKHHQEKIRTVRRLIAVSALVFALLITILIYFVSNKLTVIQANYASVKSFSKTKNLLERGELASLAWENSHGLLAKQALLMVYADIQNSTDKDSVISRIAKAYSLSFEPAPENLQFAECSKDNKYIFGYGNTSIFIWDTKGKLNKIIKADHLPIIDIKMSDDGLFMGAVSSDSILTVWNTQGELKFATKIRYNQLNTKQIFRFSIENNILALSDKHDAVLYSSDGKILQSFDRHSGSVNAVDISGDNQFLATASSDKTIVICYLNSVKKTYDFYNTLTWHSDTVWSVSFSRRNIDVLSASSDSSVIVGDINNEVIIDRGFPHDQKYCYTAFSGTNRGIIAVDYRIQNSKIHKTIIATHVDNPTFNKYTEDGLLLYGLEHDSNFDFLVFSPRETFFIYEQNCRSFLAENKLNFDYSRSIFNILELEGSKHFFTADGKYILGLKGNAFKAYFVDIQEIYKLFRAQ